MELLKLFNVTKTFETGEKCTPVDRVNLTICENDFISIMGVSGSGKSTLLMLMGGLLKPTSGDLSYCGESLYSMSDDALAKWRGKNVGYLFQNVQMVQALTLRENIELARRYGNNPKADIEELLEKLELTKLQNSLPSQMSGGQRRRALFAVTMVRDPKLILADEPTNDLDSHWSQKIVDLLEDAAQKGKAVVLVTHNSKWAGRADKRYMMENSTLNII
ncbi:MAG: ABC transporter ATP-binding protein [Zhaonellaceae bacterium]|jgi:ABC-type lipoprotein export system ATPase subunit